MLFCSHIGLANTCICIYIEAMNQSAYEICLSHSLKRADRVLTQIYNDHFAPLGIRSTQFSLLRALHIMSGGTASQLQEALVLDQTTVSRSLKPLIRDGYIDVKAGETRREKALALSDKGEALYQKALVPWKAAQRMVKARLGKGQDKALVALSRDIVMLRQ